VAHVPLEDRYMATKVRSLNGFFSVTMRSAPPFRPLLDKLMNCSVGYLDRAPPSIPDLLPYLQTLETRSAANLTVARANRHLLEQAGQNPTHVVPSYAIISRSPSGVWGWVRRVLVEELYGRARVVFPERNGAPGPEENK
jgi:KUP system potassium uptake protein